MARTVNPDNLPKIVTLSANELDVIRGILAKAAPLVRNLYSEREAMPETFDARNVSQVAEVCSRLFDAIRVTNENDRKARRVGMASVVLAAVVPFFQGALAANAATAEFLTKLTPEVRAVMGDNLPKIATHAYAPFGLVFAAVSQSYPGITHETLVEDLKRIGYETSSSKAEGLKVKIPLTAYVPPKNVATMVKENAEAAKGKDAGKGKETSPVA